MRGLGSRLQEKCIPIGTDFDQSSAKYVIRAKIEIDGVVDKPDVVGAIFGQTEGLLGEELDLRELQRTGRIGRIQIAVKSEGGISKGEIVIPVSLNKTATAILAAALETVDRVGPCTAKVTLEKLEDMRGAKRRRVVSRAISILKGWEEEIAPGAEEITGAVTRAKKKAVGKFGPDSLPAGPELENSDEIIIVEGRADVTTLMKSGIENTIAVEGTHVPKSVAELTRRKGKTIVAFLDGDRGGDLILRELMQVAKIDYIARAPEGKEVENLARPDILKALQTRIPADQALALVTEGRSAQAPRKGPLRRIIGPRREEMPRTGEDRRVETGVREPPRSSVRAPARTVRTIHKTVPQVDETYLSKIPEIRESFKAVLFGKDKQVLMECGVADLAKTLEAQQTVDTIVFDGVITQRLVDMAATKQTRLIVGAAVADIETKPASLQIVTFDDIGR
jgi:DNA primase